jgi:hypothetical protein
MCRRYSAFIWYRRSGRWFNQWRRNGGCPNRGFRRRRIIRSRGYWRNIGIWRWWWRWRILWW